MKTKPVANFPNAISMSSVKCKKDKKTWSQPYDSEEGGYEKKGTELRKFRDFSESDGEREWH